MTFQNFHRHQETIGPNRHGQADGREGQGDKADHETGRGRCSRGSGHGLNSDRPCASVNQQYFTESSQLWHLLGMSRYYGYIKVFSISPSFVAGANVFSPLIFFDIENIGVLFLFNYVTLS